MAGIGCSTVGMRHRGRVVLAAALLAVAEIASSSQNCCGCFANAAYRVIGTYWSIDVALDASTPQGEFPSGELPYVGFELPEWKEPLVVALKLDREQKPGAKRGYVVFPRIYFLDRDKSVVAVRDDAGFRFNGRDLVLGFDSGILIDESAKHVRYIVVSPNPDAFGIVVDWFDEQGMRLENAATAAVAGIVAGGAMTTNATAQMSEQMRHRLRHHIHSTEGAVSGRLEVTVRTRRRLREMRIRDWLDLSPSLLGHPQPRAYTK